MQFQWLLLILHWPWSLRGTDLSRARRESPEALASRCKAGQAISFSNQLLCDHDWDCFADARNDTGEKSPKKVGSTPQEDIRLTSRLPE